MREWKLRCIVTEEKLDNEVTGEWEEKGLTHRKQSDSSSV